MPPLQSFPLPANLAKESLLCFFQAYFKQKQDERFRFHEDDRLSKLFIFDKYSYNREVAEQRPGLVTDRGPMRWGGRHIDQFIGSQPMSSERIYKDILSATVTVNAISKEGLEAEELAQYAFLLPMIFKDILRNKVGILNILSTALGRESILKADSRPDLHVVPTEIAIEMEYAWTITDIRAKIAQAVKIGLNDPEKLGDLQKRLAS
jgi:hypothetical protein